MKWKSQLSLLAIAVAMLAGSQQAKATYYINPFAIQVSVKLSKGERIGDAVEKVFASAKEHDVTELRPDRKACGVFRREIRDPDLVLATDLDLDGVSLDIAINRLCEAAGAAFLIQEPYDDHSLSEEKFLFFRNSPTAIRDVFYEMPLSLDDHLAEKVEAAGVTPGPGEGILYRSVFRSKIVRGRNRYHAAVKKVVAETSR